MRPQSKIVAVVTSIWLVRSPKNAESQAARPGYVLHRSMKAYGNVGGCDRSATGGGGGGYERALGSGRNPSN